MAKRLKSRQSAAGPGTLEDVLIWERHYRVPYAWKGLCVYLEADRRDADLMLMLQCYKADVPGTKAMAHRMVAGMFGQDSIRIDGLWVSLA